MRNGVTLADLRKETLIEAGFSTDAGHSVYSSERINQLINRTQRRLGITYDWPNMEFEEEVTVAADTQFVNLPTDINFTMIDTVDVSYGDDWIPVTHGIGSHERSVYNSTQRALPIMRWEIEAPGNTQFEVWPIASTAQTLLFSGNKSFVVMTKDTDVCVLDADVIVMNVAALILGRDQKADAQIMLAQADELARTIIKRQGSTKTTDVNLGRRKGRNLRPGIDYIPSGFV